MNQCSKPSELSRERSQEFVMLMCVCKVLCELTGDVTPPFWLPTCASVADEDDRLNQVTENPRRLN